MIDFTKYKLSNIRYGGSEKKLGIIIDGNNYMLKFQKNSPFGKRVNHICEYIGSRIFSYLGFDTQLVFLGLYNNEQVVACKDFVTENVLFVPFNDVGESTIEDNKELYQYTYEEIIAMLNKNKKLTNVKETVSIFWEMYIVDALIGNFDRHGGNWGFLKENNKYTLAPIFDNGSSLFPQMIDENKMKYIMNDDEETLKRVYEFPTSQIKLNDKKSSYYDVINSLAYKECNDALIKIYNKINMQDIYKIIEEVEFLSKIHKNFLKHILNKRYEIIIKASYNKLMEGSNE